MKDHMEVSQGYHLTLAVKSSSSLEQQVTKLSKDVKEKDHTVARLQKECDRFERLFGDMTARLVNLERTSDRHSQLEVRLNTVEGLVDAGMATAHPIGAVSSNNFSVMTKKVEEAMGMAAQAEAEISTVQQKVTTVESKVASIDRQVSTLS